MSVWKLTACAVLLSTAPAAGAAASHTLSFLAEFQGDAFDRIFAAGVDEIIDGPVPGAPFGLYGVFSDLAVGAATPVEVRFTMDAGGGVDPSSLSCRLGAVACSDGVDAVFAAIDPQDGALARLWFGKLAVSEYLIDLRAGWLSHFDDSGFTSGAATDAAYAQAYSARFSLSQISLRRDPDCDAAAECATVTAVPLPPALPLFGALCLWAGLYARRRATTP